MVQFDPVTGALVLPIWVSATLAALLVGLAAIAIARGGAFRTIMTLLALGVVGYGAWAGSVLIEHLGRSEQVEAHRVFDQRINELDARAVAPGSPLSCLAAAGDQLALSCERVIFGSPENVAAAISYINARVAMLIEGLDLAARGDAAAYDAELNGLRRTLESDRFGVVAYVLSQQPNCGPEQCEALQVLRDPNRVRANLQDKTFDGLVARYAASWNQTRGSVADLGKGGSVIPTIAPPGAPVSSKYDFPSAASIPPVSILNSEPAAGAATPASAPAATASTPPPAPTLHPPAARRPPAARAPVARANATAQENPPPVPLAPATSAAPTSSGARPPQQ